MSDDQRPDPPAADDPSATRSGLPATPSPAAASPGGLPSWLLIGVALGLLVILTLVGLYVLRLGPFEPAAEPTASPTPGAIATSPPPTDRPPTDEPPTASPAASPTTTAPPATPTPSPDTTAIGLLLTHVPADIRDGCQPSTGLDGVSALLSCPTTDGRFTLNYAQFGDDQALTQIYDATFRTSEIDRDSGNCGDASTWPAEASYSIDGQPNGRFLCMLVDDVPAIYWTDTPLVIFAWMTAEPSDERALYEFWRTAAGPLP
jgi:hypothetical protein